MDSRTFVTVCALCLAVSCGACSTSEQLARDQIVPGEDYDVLEVTTTTGEHLVMKQLAGGGSVAVRDSTIVGVTEKGELVKLPFSQISSIQISVPDSAKTTLFIVLGIPIGLFALAALSWHLGGGLW